jgi:hypothetical protein
MDNRPLLRGDRARLFRGENAKVWERRLRERYQWPQPLAGQLASFLTGEGPMPSWPPELPPELPRGRPARTRPAGSEPRGSSDG